MPYAMVNTKGQIPWTGFGVEFPVPEHAKLLEVRAKVFRFPVAGLVYGVEGNEGDKRGWKLWVQGSARDETPRELVRDGPCPCYTRRI